jgi:Predicted nucleic acid-binding protein, contains PIN domain
MQILVDSNILLRSAEVASPQREAAKESVRVLSKSHQVVIVPQVAYEFWAVMTRSLAANGLGLSIEEADLQLRDFLDVFHLIQDERGIFQQWWEIVRTHKIKGVPSHDARLVAAMRRHQISHLLTFNSIHFKNFNDITVLTPEAVLAGN